MDTNHLLHFIPKWEEKEEKGPLARFGFTKEETIASALHIRALILPPRGANTCADISGRDMNLEKEV